MKRTPSLLIIMQSMSSPTVVSSLEFLQSAMGKGIWSSMSATPAPRARAMLMPSPVWP